MMEKHEIAANLLAGKTCDTCAISCSEKQDTCEFWKNTYLHCAMCKFCLLMAFGKKPICGLSPRSESCLLAGKK
jgi:hypothetical protein